MQWLIDLVIKAIGVPPCYVNRGDATGTDFTMADLTMDWGVHYLDLSGIIPEGATAVHLYFAFVANAAGTCMWLQPSDCVHCFSALGMTSQVANIEIDCDGFVALGPDRKIKYQGGAPPMTAVFIHVRGWMK